MSLPLPALRVAIVGSGPAGFYAAESLQKAGLGAAIDLFDRLPTPYGLVRGGVAPDHPKIKSVTRVFDRIASQPGFRFFGNVRVGEALSPAELRQYYDAVIFATGAELDRHLDIPGEHLAGSHSATELVGWYNGHPDYLESRFDFSKPAAAVIGIGNVAMDATRILATSPDVLATTDLAVHALEAFRDSQVETMYIMARRGPIQAACTTPELREMGELEGVQVVVDPTELELDPVSAEHLANDHDRTAENNMALLRHWASEPPTAARRRIVFRFCVSPVEITGHGHVSGVRVVKNTLVPDGHGSVRAVRTDQEETIPVGLVFRSVGYRGTGIDGLPFDAQRGIVPNVGGRVVEGPGSHTPIRGVYVTGWIKRGPRGVIGTNKSCAAETVDLLVADAAAGRLARPAGGNEPIEEILADREVDVVTWADWLALDRAEKERGAPAGRPREKFVTIPEMLEAIRRARGDRS